MADLPPFPDPYFFDNFDFDADFTTDFDFMDPAFLEELGNWTADVPVEPLPVVAENAPQPTLSGLVSVVDSSATPLPRGDAEITSAPLVVGRGVEMPPVQVPEVPARQPYLRRPKPLPAPRRGVPWTEEEHRLFLLGLSIHGKGDWKSISRHFVRSRTPTQVASHAQKYYNRHTKRRTRRRPSIHDITSADGPSPWRGRRLSIYDILRLSRAPGRIVPPINNTYQANPPPFATAAAAPAPQYAPFANYGPVQPQHRQFQNPNIAMPEPGGGRNRFVLQQREMMLNGGTYHPFAPAPPGM